MEPIFILLIAVIIDLIFGELPNQFHPVAWLGKLISLLLKIRPSKNNIIQILYGAIIVIFTICIITGLVYLLIHFIKPINEIIFIVISGMILKFTFSIKKLIQTALKIKKLLDDSKIKIARNNLKSLVSRKTDQLDSAKIISATVESVAENSCDSFIAPVFYFILFGIYGSIVYRIINTFDSMIGYHGEWEYIGKFAARLDDAFNYIPARISALLIILATYFAHTHNFKHAWNIMISDHNKTESPNAGWTMSAMAGALGIELEKDGCYKLGQSHSILSTSIIDKSIRLIVITFTIWSLLIITIQGVLFVIT